MAGENPSAHGKKPALSTGGWVAVLCLGGLFGAAMWYGFRAWEAVPDRMTTNGFIAMAFSIVFTIALGAGLMALLFWSHRKGYDR